jgi:hypothetical protein
MSNTKSPSNDNFLVGADPCVRPNKGAHAGAPLQFRAFRLRLGIRRFSVFGLLFSVKRPWLDVKGDGHRGFAGDSGAIDAPLRKC